MAVRPGIARPCARLYTGPGPDRRPGFATMRRSTTRREDGLAHARFRGTPGRGERRSRTTTSRSSKARAHRPPRARARARPDQPGRRDQPVPARSCAAAIEDRDARMLQRLGGPRAGDRRRPSSGSCARGATGAGPSGSTRLVDERPDAGRLRAPVGDRDGRRAAGHRPRSTAPRPISARRSSPSCSTGWPRSARRPRAASASWRLSRRPVRAWSSWRSRTTDAQRRPTRVDFAVARHLLERSGGALRHELAARRRQPDRPGRCGVAAARRGTARHEAGDGDRRDRQRPDGQLTVLVCDDDASLRSLVSRVLAAGRDRRAGGRVGRGGARRAGHERRRRRPRRPPHGRHDRSRALSSPRWRATRRCATGSC